MKTVNSIIRHVARRTPLTEAQSRDRSLPFAKLFFSFHGIRNTSITNAIGSTCSVTGYMNDAFDPQTITVTQSYIIGSHENVTQ